MHSSEIPDDRGFKTDGMSPKSEIPARPTNTLGYKIEYTLGPKVEGFAFTMGPNAETRRKYPTFARICSDKEEIAEWVAKARNSKHCSLSAVGRVAILL